MTVVDHVRSYSLLKLGVSLAEQEDMPAVTADWLLKINEAVIERQKKELGG